MSLMSLQKFKSFGENVRRGQQTEMQNRQHIGLELARFQEKPR